MEIVPPSYETAITRDAWAIIAQYIPSADLCAVSLVCHRWHKLFMPFLWGDPASHFGTENDAVYVALTRFRRTLRYARVEVRMLTHTLHLPPALSEIYGGPRPEWLRDILLYLPCLQSLIVSKLPFFDHNAMTALRDSTRYGQPGYNVRLLRAEHEPNTTSQGLSETLLHFQGLNYLDLSYTTSARDSAVISCLSQLEHLQVLKLRGIGLKDNHAEFLANAIGTRVRFLDLRNNLLTDMAVRSLLQACFLPPNIPLPGSGAPESGAQGGTWASANDVSPFTPNPSHSLFKRSDLDEQFIKNLTQPLTGRSWVENLSHVGVTHLYLADNQITVEGVASLLTSARLHALDVGTVDTAQSVNRLTQTFSPSYEGFPGAEKLIPILSSVAKENLTYFRAHHAVLTADAPSKDPTVPSFYISELPGTIPDVVHESNHTAAELTANNEIHELSAETNPIFELADTSIPQPTEPSLPVEAKSPLHVYADEPLPARKRGSVFAPEVVEPIAGTTNYDAMMSPEETGTLMSVSGVGTVPVSTESPHGQKVQELLRKRPKNPALPRKDRKSSVPYLHPSYVPHLETLVLTDVPSHVPVDSPILTYLIRFITACSNEALLAALQGGSDYSLPPGQARLQAEQARSRSLFSLRRLVLEITPTSELERTSRLSPWKATRNSNGTFKSTTGDRDLEKLWTEAMDDFSFFETECGIPENDPGKYFPMAALNEKVSLMPEDDDSTSVGLSGRDTLRQPSRSHSRTRSRANSNVAAGSGHNSPTHEVPTVDLVAELASFRRAKKTEYEEQLRHDRRRRRSTTEVDPGKSTGMDAGTWNSATTATSSSRLSPSPSSLSNRPLSRSSSSATVSVPQLAMAQYVEGHWKGEVKIVRNSAPKGRSGVVDMYGNYFEKGYLYP